MTDVEHEQRFRTLAELILEPVRRYLLRRTDMATADDVLSETLLVCWRRLDELPVGPDETIPWVIGVARNLLANAQRAERRRTRLTGKIIALDPPAPVVDDANPDGAVDADGVRDALAQLRSADAELLRLWAWDGLESPQLATVLGISSNAAAIRLHRAKARLKEELLKARGYPDMYRMKEGAPMEEVDRALREQLRAADPAQRIAPLPDTWLDYRMEEIMIETTTTPAVPTPRARRAWVPLVGAAAAAAIAVPLVLGGTPTTEQLAQPNDGGLALGSCLPVSPEGLLAQEQAFAARVIALDGGIVTLEVTERFAGEVADRVEVQQVDAITSDFSSVPFEAGESYLVAASDGMISGCGLSGTDSAELRAIYDAAFG